MTGEAVHANCLVVGTFGILIRGVPGSGKSELTDTLIDAAGTKGNLGVLVADDRVFLTAGNEQVIARAPDTIRGKMEIRGAGLVDAGVMVADEKRLRQVLFNLIANAVRYSEENGVVDVSCKRDSDKVTFVVQDHGYGIPAEILTQVFNRFVGHDTGSRRQGAGLGLAIVKSFVELHGGTVDIDSAEGKGTTVTCVFPARPERSDLVAAE